jgi:hypothetical protein
MHSTLGVWPWPALHDTIRLRSLLLRFVVNVTGPRRELPPTLLSQSSFNTKLNGNRHLKRAPFHKCSALGQSLACSVEQIVR